MVRALSLLFSLFHSVPIWSGCHEIQSGGGQYCVCHGCEQVLVRPRPLLYPYCLTRSYDHTSVSFARLRADVSSRGCHPPSTCRCQHPTYQYWRQRAPRRHEDLLLSCRSIFFPARPDFWRNVAFKTGKGKNGGRYAQRQSYSLWFPRLFVNALHLLTVNCGPCSHGLYPPGETQSPQP